MLSLALAIVLVLKPLVALAIVLLLRDTVRTALTVAVGLAQIGEFSFILAALGVSLGVLPEEGTNLLVATAILSIGLNPLLFRMLPAIEARFSKAPEREGEAAELPAGEREPNDAPVVIVGLEELGRRLVSRSLSGGIRVCVIDNQLERLEALRARGAMTVFGDAALDAVLEAAGIGVARVVVVTSPSLAVKMNVCAAIRRLNPRIAIVATAESTAERAWLREFGVAYIADVYDEMCDSLVLAMRRLL